LYDERIAAPAVDTQAKNKDNAHPNKRESCQSDSYTM
jgi:hypothetical protein